MRKEKISHPTQQKPGPQKAMLKKDNTLSSSFLLLAYLIIPVITPNFYTLDTAGVKFLAISLLNLISFTVITFSSDYKKRPEIQAGYFTSYVGMAYSLLIVLSLLSFSVGINLGEAIMTFSKLLTIFTASYILYILINNNRKHLDFIAIVLAFILLSDNISVFYHMLYYIAGEVRSIIDIKTVYSHKNILSSALFVKIPAAIYLVFFTRGWQKTLGYVSGLTAILATLLLSTRAFYLGLVVLILGLITYAVLRLLATKSKGPVILIARWVSIFIMLVLIYSIAQKYLFPKNQDSQFNITIKERLSSISSGESNTMARLGSWKRTVNLISQHPLLGVGTGNWKIQVLKYENPSRSDFIYMCKNHNDFLEYTAETGIPGGLAFLSIFIFILIGFARSCLKPDAEVSGMKLLFLPAFGILAYSIDAFFNFPADRPELQTLFAIYVALGITAFNKDDNTYGKSSRIARLITSLQKKPFPKLILFCTYLVLLLASWFLFSNAKSLRYQRYYRQDLESKKMEHPAQMMIEGFPGIPDIALEGEPIAVAKARYLIYENRFREAITLLLHDHASPYDSRREYFLAMSYKFIHMNDSALYYARIAHRLKPLNPSSANTLSDLLWEKGLQEESILVMDTLLQKVKSDRESWLRASNYQAIKGNYEKAMLIVNDAIQYFPDTSFFNLRKKIDYNLKVEPHKELYNKAIKAYQEQRYPESLKFLTEFITKEPRLADAYSMRAYCFYKLKQFNQSIDDINIYFKQGGTDFSYVNLRGECWYSLGRFDKACNNFKIAMEQGISAGRENYKKLCLNK